MYTLNKFCQNQKDEGKNSERDEGKNNERDMVTTHTHTSKPYSKESKNFHETIHILTIGITHLCVK